MYLREKEREYVREREREREEGGGLQGLYFKSNDICVLKQCFSIRISKCLPNKNSPLIKHAHKASHQARKGNYASGKWRHKVEEIIWDTESI
jgi:hypothetical protein